MDATSFWNQSTAALTQALGSGTAGLATEEANQRLSVYGPNDAAAPKRRPAWQRFLVLFADPLVIICCSPARSPPPPGIPPALSLS